jgi:multidrug efflux pump subunit AcrB
LRFSAEVLPRFETSSGTRPDLSPGHATKLAMREITAPIIAITLVLLSVDEDC